MKKKNGKAKMLGRYIIADPEVCHGEPTFKGTRIMVWQVLAQVAKGKSWDTIVYEWRGSVPKEAIAEAIQLAKQAFVDGSQKYVAPENYKRVSA
jgi:uncharacterized protein (DUF433 family)